MSQGNNDSGNSVQGATEHLRQTASQIGDNVRNIGNQVRDAAKDKFGEVQHTAEDYYNTGRDRAMEWERGLEQSVSENPVRAVLIAAGVGVVIGLLFRR